MRKIWTISKLTFALAILALFLNGQVPTAVGAEEGCNTSTACRRNFLSCECVGVGCSGCFIANGETGCGHCYKDTLSD